MIFTGIGVLLSVTISLDPLAWHHSNAQLSQAATAVSASQDLLVDLFERIENFFRRLEVYLDVSPTAGMTDIIVKVMTELLSVLGTAMKEIKQGKASELIPEEIPSLLAYSCLETFLKKLVGRTDIEDALRRLDKLTQDEVRMAAAEGLKATHRVDDNVARVRNEVLGVSDQVLGISNQVHNIDDQVQGIGDQVQGVGDHVLDAIDQVQGVDDRVKRVDDKIDVVIDGV